MDSDSENKRQEKIDHHFSAIGARVADGKRELQSGTLFGMISPEKFLLMIHRAYKAEIEILVDEIIALEKEAQAADRDNEDIDDTRDEGGSETP